MADQIALRLVSGNFYLTADAGGGRTTDPSNDPIHSDRKVSQGISDWEKFRLMPAGSGTYALMTFDGLHYVTADQGGGKSTDAIHTDATAIGLWETFILDFQDDGSYSIQTANGNFISAVGGRHKDAVRTVQTTVGAGEKFWMIVAMPL